MRRFIVAIALSLLVSGCAGGGGTSANSSVIPSAAQRSSASAVVFSAKYPYARVLAHMPTPYREGIDTIVPTSHTRHDVPANWPHSTPPLPNAVNPAARQSASGKRSAQNSLTAPDNGGQAGFLWTSTAGDGNVYVAQSALLSDFFGGSFSLITPPSGVAYSVLDAPTTHGGAGNCIEGITDYSNGFGWSGSTKGQFQVYDFCRGSFEGQWDMDSSFFDDYVAVYEDSGNDIPKYILEETTTRSLDGFFHALIHNNVTGNWDDFYDANSGLPNSRTDGWSIFETHYGASGDTATEACSNADSLSETGLRLHNTSGFFPVVSTSVSTVSNGDCFTAPLSSYYYSFGYNFSSDSQWVVTTF